MFTGIIEDIGKVFKIIKKSGNVELIVKNNRIFDSVKNGDSISVNGVCLTVTGISKDTMQFDIMTETIKKTNLFDLKVNSPVNIERAVILNGRLDGHYVMGHVDCVSKIISKYINGETLIIEFNVPQEFSKYIVQRGSVAIDGISLTVAEKNGMNFKVGLVKFTQNNTILPKKKIGESVNIEFDIIGKYLFEFYISEKKCYENK